MAYSGVGSGTISDPYQVTNHKQLAEMGTSAYSASDYFLLMNDIEMGSSRVDSSLFELYIYANLDGSSYKLTFPGDRTNIHAIPQINLYRSNVTVKNIQINFTDVNDSAGLIMPQGTFSNITFDNCRFIINSYFQNISETNTTINYFLYGECPSTWTMRNLYIEGPFRYIFQSVRGSLENIAVVNTRKQNFINTGFFCSNFTGTDTYMKNISIKFPYLELYQGGVLAYNISGTRNTIEQCYITGKLAGNECGVISYLTTPTTVIKNCYFNGALVDYAEAFNTNGINFTRDGDPSLINNYAYIHSIEKALYHEYDTSEYFDDLGFTDWHIPSKDEFNLCITKAGVPLGTRKYQGATQFGWITSSESSSTNIWTYNYNGFQSYPKIPAANTYYQLFPVRNFSYTTLNDEPSVGKPYLGGYCIYVDTSTKTGIMTGAGWVCNGAKLFNFGSSGSWLNTSTGIGTGQTNTALMAAARTSAQGATQWNGDYVYPTKPSYSFYPLAPYVTANHTHNYCTVLSKETNQTINSWAGQEYMTDASLRDVSTYVSWDFTNTWKQEASGCLPTLKDPSVNQDKYVGIYSIIDTSLKNIEIVLNKYADVSIFPDSSVGLIVEIYNGAEIYDASGYIHNITLSDVSDFHLVIKPYHSGADKIVPYYRDYFFYPYAKFVVDSNYWWRPNASAITLNAATVGTDVKTVHGCVLIGNYIYGCSRHDPKIIRINKDNYADTSVVTISGSGWVGGMDQIVYCNGYIWGIRGSLLVRLDPSTMAYKTAVLGNITMHGSEPILASHDRYIYEPGVQYINKYDTNYFLGTDISTNCPDACIGNALIGTYDSYTQGQYLLYDASYPLYIGSAKGACHSAIQDGDYLYIAYTTAYGTFGDTLGGFNASTGLSVHEVHKIDTTNMSAVSYANIPKCTDDMDQDLEYLYLGCEIQTIANPSTLGYGCSIVAVRKTDMKVFMLSRTEGPRDIPPTQQSYGVFKRGNLIIDLRTSGGIPIINASEPSVWSLNTPVGKYVQDYIYPQMGASNDLVIDYSTYFHTFVWVVSGGAPYPSKLYKCLYPSRNIFTAKPLVMSLGADVSAS